MLKLFEKYSVAYPDLYSCGLDRDDLEMMDEEERRTALEDAGLDPDDYDNF